MVESLNQRLRKYLDRNKISSAELGRLILSKRGDVASWFNQNGMVDIPPKKVLEIIKVFKDLNARWLITGEGEMLEGAIPEPCVNEPKPSYGKDALQLIREISEENGILKERIRCLEDELKHLSGRGQGQARARAG